MGLVAAQTAHHQNDSRWYVDHITEGVEIAPAELHIARCDGAHAAESSFLEFANSFVVRGSSLSKYTQGRISLLFLTNLALALQDLI